MTNTSAEPEPNMALAVLKSQIWSCISASQKATITFISESTNRFSILIRI